MNRVQRQLLIASLVLVVILAGYYGIREYSAQAERKEQEAQEAAVTAVTNFEIGDVRAFSYAFEGTEVSMELQDEGWKAANDETVEIDTGKIESFLESFCAIKSQNEIKDMEDLTEFGLDNSASVITFEFSNEQTLTCYVGNHNDVMDLYYFMTDGSDAIYTVDSTTVNMLSYTVEDFAVEEAEEEEEEEQTGEETGAEAEETEETETVSE